MRVVVCHSAQLYHIVRPDPGSPCANKIMGFRDRNSYPTLRCKYGAQLWRGLEQNISSHRQICVNVIVNLLWYANVAIATSVKGLLVVNHSERGVLIEIRLV